MSSLRSKNLTPRRPTQVVVPMTPPQKPEGPLQPVDTSSQASAKVVEASLEDIPTSISPIAAVSRTGSVTALVDAMKLWANANKALEDLLTTKASIDACRQRAIWELGIELCRNESQAAKSIKEAKAVCSRATLDAQTTCSWVILEAKTTCSAAVKETKTTRGLNIQKAEATCSKAINEVEAQREFFSKHSYNFTTDGTHNLSEIFKQVAMSADLLGTSIHEIQAHGLDPMNWKKQTMLYNLYPKVWSFSMWYPLPNPLRLWDWWEYMTQMPFAISVAWPTALGVERRARMRGPWLIIYGQCTTGWAWCATGVIIACPQCLTLSTTTAGRTVANLGRTTLMS